MKGLLAAAVHGRRRIRLLLAGAALVAMVSALAASAAATMRPPTAKERASITRAVLHEAGPVYARKLVVVSIAVSSISAQWAVAAWEGKPGYKTQVQREGFILKRRGAGWKAYSPNFTCHPPGASGRGEARAGLRLLLRP